MKLLIRSAKIIDNESPFNNKVMDILVEDGNIKEIAPQIKTKKVDREITLDNLHVSQGWFDSSVNFGEPGFEDRETLENGLRTAGKSGFTSIALNSGNDPVTDNKGAVSFLKNKAQGQPVALYPIGALTRKSEGTEMAELFDMQQAGAVAFGDYQRAVSNPNMLKLALQYTQNFDGLVLSFPQENKIAGNGQVNEHEMSTLLGLKGIPALAEELQITRDLYILEYTGGKLHIPTISTAKAVDIIRDAKEKGLDVTCGVAIHNLFFTDEILKEFDTNAKVLPPLRTKADVKALLQGIKDGTIDMVTTDHSPMDVEHKKVEFDNALYGTLGLESALGALLKITSLKTAVKMLTAGKSRFNIPENVIEEGAPANLTFFDPEVTYTFEKEHIWSTSRNSLFLGQELKGKVYGILSDSTFLASED
ncbi:dihydroorotase [Salinimicrobium catena]|uniref:Dihydroorotase n=1 Tax=Salinimicrobium catena TaxID=390640 RepID=A0A1H5LW34_9FLAO|nr:dihydroorotase [Salinimicrobium catena]SDL15209.1 dihydroorotase [Salinimicrobium catena]SEE81194.1 dihydroorotase [Salinimicrobium catena]